MTLAVPYLYVFGGVFIGLAGWAFDRRHHLIGGIMLIAAAACLITAALGNTVTIPRPGITVHPHITMTP